MGMGMGMGMGMDMDIMEVAKINALGLKLFKVNTLIQSLKIYLLDSFSLQRIIGVMYNTPNISSENTNIFIYITEN